MKYLAPILNILDGLTSDHLQIEPTTRCNLNCKTCSRGEGGVPLIDITQETFAKILSSHKNISFIKLQGMGEPLLHPKFDILCSFAKEYCNNKGYKCNITTNTNGTLFIPDKVSDLSDLNISLDTLNTEISKEIKGKNYNLDIVLSNIIQYNEILPITVNFTRTIYNYKEEPAIHKWCNDYNIKFNCTRVQNWSDPTEISYLSNSNDCLQERKLFGNMGREKNLCVWRHLKYYYYRADGVRNPCCRRIKYQTYSDRCCETCPD
jgi:MoaA/NifB/PqqE/SkfB family radical SAM enzyme